MATANDQANIFSFKGALRLSSEMTSEERPFQQPFTLLELVHCTTAGPQFTAEGYSFQMDLWQVQRMDFCGF